MKVLQTQTPLTWESTYQNIDYKALNTDNKEKIINKNITMSKNNEEIQNWNSYTDDWFGFDFPGKTEVTQKLTDVEEDEDEEEINEEDSKYYEDITTSTENQVKWICKEIHDYKNPWSEQIEEIINNTREVFLNVPEFSSPNHYQKSKSSSMNGYSNSTSHFSNFPNIGTTRKMHKFSNNPSYIDHTNSISVSSQRKVEKTPRKPNIELFEKYEKEVQIQRRLINKVCADRELSDLILNLYNYKKMYRDLQHQSIIEKEDALSYTKNRLFPKHMPSVPKDNDLHSVIKEVEKERDQFRKEKENLQK